MLADHPRPDCLVEKLGSPSCLGVDVINYSVKFEKVHLLGTSGEVSYIIRGNELGAYPAT
jgi:hypothetical protein